MTISRPLFYLGLSVCLLMAAYIVFRKIVRRDYMVNGTLNWFSSLLQLLAFTALICFPYLFLPPEWAWFWELEDTWFDYVGFGLLILGFAFAFGTMFWFGIRRAFGLQSAGLIESGPYRFSRNPQVIGGYLLVIGVAIQWPSIYLLGWIMLYAIICQMMIMTEEEYLSKSYGEAYDQYKARVPRYLRLRSRHKKAAV